MGNLIDEEKYSPELKALDTIYHALLIRLDTNGRPPYAREYAMLVKFIIQHTPDLLRRIVITDIIGPSGRMDLTDEEVNEMMRKYGASIKVKE